jgi:hypothetical protein
MATTRELLEQKLRHDLRHHLADRLDHDEKFVRQLYQGLTNRTWWRQGEDRAVHIALSWTRAEELINAVRTELGKAPMDLDHSGGEGTLTSDVEEELGKLGWTSAPLDTSEHDDAHLDSPADPPLTPPQDTLREGHEKADEEIRRRIGL